MTVSISSSMGPPLRFSSKDETAITYLNENLKDITRAVEFRTLTGLLAGYDTRAVNADWFGPQLGMFF